MPYSCNTRGRCEPDRRGRYQTAAECERDCESVHQRDLLLLTMSFDPTLASGLAPSDQVEVIYKITGVVLEPELAAEVLDYVINDDPLDAQRQYSDEVKLVHSRLIRPSRLILKHYLDTYLLPSEWDDNEFEQTLPAVQAFLRELLGGGGDVHYSSSVRKLVDELRLPPVVSNVLSSGQGELFLQQLLNAHLPALARELLD